MEYDSFITHSIDMYMGKPKSGKTMIAGSYPKPLLYVSIGNDGGGRVLLMNYREDVQKGLIKVKNLSNDKPLNGKILKTSCDKLAELLRDLRKPGADKFKTIVIDTLGGLQDDYRSYMEFAKGGKKLSQQEYGDVQTMMLSLKDNMKRFSEEQGTIIVWCTHTREQEVYETSGLNKEIRIVSDLTISTGTKYMKDASNIFYCCRKTTVKKDGTKGVSFVTYVGPHPLMDTGTRDMALKMGDFVEDFTYDKWQAMVEQGTLSPATVVVPETEQENDDEENKN